MRLFQEEIGFPEIYWNGIQGDHYIMVMEYLGSNIDLLFKYCGNKFSPKTHLMIARQIVFYKDQIIKKMARIETLHRIGFIHRDIKPANFLIGLLDNASTIYAIDFGLVKPYMDPRTQKHIPYKTRQLVIGTARYSTINMHLGIEASRRDDLIGLMYTLCFFACGSLPWQGMKAENSNAKHEMILKVKSECKPEILCKGLSDWYLKLFNLIAKLTFEQEPDYRKYNKILDREFRKINQIEDDIFDWSIISFVFLLTNYQKRKMQY